MIHHFEGLFIHHFDDARGDETVRQERGDLVPERGIRLKCVIECVGSPATIAQAIDWAGKGATVMLFGLTGPDAEITVKPDVIFKKELRITSSFINPYTYSRAIELLRTGAVDVTTMIRNVIPLEELERALAADTLRKQGKVAVKLS